MKRRQFIQYSSSGALLLLSGKSEHHWFDSHEIVNLSILHTNDMHSRIEPFPMDGSRNEGLGGVARRSKLIQQIRQNESNVLLLDAGDIFQGTPYFNFFGGEVEIKAMSMMHYDAATIGNHDFDAGMDNLKKQLSHASFSMINCNYNFSNTVMHDQIRPYQIFEKAGIKIGVTGVGIELQSLVPKELTGDTVYLDPVASANKTAAVLKNELDCDYVICLSHLGFKYKEDKVDDIDLASQSKDIDLIIGGHTHTFLKEPEIVANANNKAVIVNQVGWAGIMLGRLDVQFERSQKNKCVSCKNLFVQSL